MLYYAEINYCTMGLGKKNYMPPCQLTMGFAVMFKVPNTFFLDSLIHTLIHFVQHDCNVQYFVVVFCYFFTLL